MPSIGIVPTNLNPATVGPAFYRYDDNRLLVLFQVSLAGAPFIIVANLMEDSTADLADCQLQYQAAERQKKSDVFR